MGAASTTSTASSYQFDVSSTAGWSSTDDYDLTSIPPRIDARGLVDGSQFQQSDRDDDVSAASSPTTLPLKARLRRMTFLDDDDGAVRQPDVVTTPNSTTSGVSSSASPLVAQKSDDVVEDLATDIERFRDLVEKLAQAPDDALTSLVKGHLSKEALSSLHRALVVTTAPACNNESSDASNASTAETHVVVEESKVDGATGVDLDAI